MGKINFLNTTSEHGINFMTLDSVRTDERVKEETIELNLTTMRENKIKYAILIVYNFKGGIIHDLYTKLVENSSDGKHLSQFE